MRSCIVYISGKVPEVKMSLKGFSDINDWKASNGERQQRTNSALRFFSLFSFYL